MGDTLVAEKGAFASGLQSSRLDLEVVSPPQTSDTSTPNLDHPASAESDDELFACAPSPNPTILLEKVVLATNAEPQRGHVGRATDPSMPHTCPQVAPLPEKRNPAPKKTRVSQRVKAA